MNNISFLIGSGFSVPAGYPTTSEINRRLTNIDQSEIVINTGGSAFFLNGRFEPNVHCNNVVKRQFMQEFLEFYNSEVLDPSISFHYETFYDYYTTCIPEIV